MRPIAHHLPQRLRLAVRALRQSPVFALSAIVSLGLALALNTTMFALIDAVRHPYVPYPEPDRLVSVTWWGGDRNRPVAFAERERALRDGAPSLAAVTTYARVLASVQTASGGEDQMVAVVPGDFFAKLGALPAFGRTLGAGDMHGEAGSVAVVSFAFWNRLLAGRSLGGHPRVDVNGRSYIVVGVMPRGAHLPDETDVWLPADDVFRSQRLVGPAGIARLAPLATRQSAALDLSAVGARLSATYGHRNPLTARVAPIRQRAWGATSIPWFFRVSAGIVLALACANLGAMMLARGLARRRETAVRIALGARRRSIAGHVLLECALIVAGGALLGIVLTVWAMRTLPGLVMPYVPMIGDLQTHPSWRAFAFVLALAAVAAVAAALVPALHAAAVSPAEPMKEGSGTLTARERHRYHPLVIVEVMLAMGLLMSCALFALFAARLAGAQFQFPAKRIVHAFIAVRPRDAADSAAATRIHHDVLARVRRLPGTELAAYRGGVTPRGGVVTAENGASGSRWVNVSGYGVVGADYFRIFGIRILEGRAFTEADGHAAERVAIVDENAARLLWPDVESPVGRMLQLGDEKSKAPWVRVVGVARGSSLRATTSSTESSELSVWVSESPDDIGMRDLVVLTDGRGGDRGLAAYMLSLRRELQKVGPPLVPFVNIRPWLSQHEAILTAASFLAWLFGAFSVFGASLCAVGLYGVLSYAVRRRLREFAVRIALGAPDRAILRIVLREIAVTVLAGIGIGAFGALWLSRAVADMVDTVPHVYVAALLIAEFVLFAVSALAALGPVRQAMRADPVEILRAS